MADLIPNRQNPILSGLDITSKLAPLFLGSGNKSATVSENTSTTTSSQTLSDAIIAALTGNITGGAYSKDAAISDSAAAMDAATRKMLEAYMPKIAASNIAGGAYNNTTTQLLMNDLQSRIAGEAANMRLQNIKDYANIQTQQADALKGAKVTNTVSNVGTKQIQEVNKAPIEDPLMGILGIVGSALAPSLIGSLAKGIFTSGDSGASDAPPGMDNKRKENDLFSTAGSAAISDFISPVFSSNSLNSAFSSISDPISQFLSSGIQSSGSPNISSSFSSSYNSPSVFSSVLDSVFSGGGGGSILDTIGEAASNFNLGGFLSDLFSWG